MRRCLPHIVFAVAMSLSLPALAADPQGCPPGSWFCAEADVETPPPAAAPTPPPPQDVADDEEDVEAAPAPPPPAIEVEAPPAARPPISVEVNIEAHARIHRKIKRKHIRRAPPPPPPVVVYQPVPSAPPTRVIIVGPAYPVRAVPPPARVAPPKPVRPRWRSEFGMNFRVEGLIFGKDSGAAFNAGMGGVGLSLRYRPVPAFAFDVGLDILAGNDYNGFERTETPLTLSGMLFLNPRSRVQVYMLGGVNFSRAQVTSDSYTPLLNRDGDSFSSEYTYFGGHGGLGLEFRLSKRVAFDVDFTGFVRKRTDDNPQPEFVNWETGETTNVSGGGMLRGGISFWW